MKKLSITFCLFLFTFHYSFGQDIGQLWKSPPAQAKPWVFWYWMQGAVSKEGITADVEAMREAGIEGAYLMPIKGVPEKPFVTPVVEQLSPLWWDMVHFAFKEADRVGLKIGFHICDGFALAGGPWITPELSMQKVVWKKTSVKGGTKLSIELPQPESYKDYYNDIAVFAYPTKDGEGISSLNVKPKVTNSLNADAQFLADAKSKEAFRSDSACWIQYEFEKPFVCRSIQIIPAGNNIQGDRMTVLASDDGVHFREIVRLSPPRQGWQNYGFSTTHSIPSTTARYFRFEYDKSGTEPGAEDLDAAKWKQSLKIKGILLSSESRIHQYEGKSGAVWRVAPWTDKAQISDELCIDPKEIKDISQYMDKSGKLNWDAPAGNWTIIRMGHTSTGHTNATGGKGAGLECDKFNPDAIRLQFNSWFGKAFDLVGKDIAARTLKIFHVDSWECGSQNWSSNFRDEFKERRGYDLYPFLPVMAGIPIETAKTSERILYDVRQTISELVADKFYATLKHEANAKGCEFSAENVSPTMLSDGMLHFKNTDIPMGEYWLQSPTHDKPNDVLDAVSAAHIYEKNIVKAESFTQLRTMFNEHPAMLKTLQDRHYALGINKLSYHVYVHNPWLDRKPGMTLDGIGLYFQRDQTWWKSGKAWVDYAVRCHTLLQYGKPVRDIAVFTGEELPRRAILPERLVPYLPGIFGEEKVEKERLRLANTGLPTHQEPVGVTHSANITGAKDWVNALRGYQYDSFNRDALLNLAQVKDGKIVLPEGMSYNILIVPGGHPMLPNPEKMSLAVASKLHQLAKDGAKILISDIPENTLSYSEKGDRVDSIMRNSSFLKLPYTAETFKAISLDRDFTVTEAGRENTYAEGIAYTHRQSDEADIYFVANQHEKKRKLHVSLRVKGKKPELWYPVSGEIDNDINWSTEDERTILPLDLDANESVFIVLRRKTDKKSNSPHERKISTNVTINTPWKVQFATYNGKDDKTIVITELTDWSKNKDEYIRYYSGTADYQNSFNLKPEQGSRYFIELDEIYNLAEIKINGQLCGTLWTKPFRLDVTNALKKGKNTIEISVTNTWANRMAGEEKFGVTMNPNEKIWTNAPYRLSEKELVKSGLTGEVRILKEKILDK